MATGEDTGKYLGMCVFCGGNTPATTMEHCPPRAMFQNRQWPEGFEFPACDACNHGTADADVLVAMLSRMDPIEEKGDLDGKQNGLMRNTHKQFPGMFQKMILSPIEARRQNRAMGITPKPGQTHQEAAGVRVTPEMHRAVCVFSSKLAKAIFFMETGSIFPADGGLMLNWFSNADLLPNGRYKVFDILGPLGGEVRELKRSGKSLNSQFEFKITMSADKTLLVIQAAFGKAFGTVTIGTSTPGRLEAFRRGMREKTGKDGPFLMLQPNAEF
jgi:hypothetical protein